MVMDNEKAETAFVNYYTDRIDLCHDEAYRVLLALHDYIDETLCKQGYVDIPWLGTLRLEGKSVTFSPYGMGDLGELLYS